MSLNIFMARHGQNQDNERGILNGHRDEPLTSLGVQQAKQLAEHIKKRGIKFDEIYSSPLTRAYTTAAIIAETLGMEEHPTSLELLIERNFGVMTGKPAKDIEKLCSPDIIKTDTITYFLNPGGAETFPQLLNRGRIALEHIQKDHEDGDVLLVCHGDIGKMIYAAYYDLPWETVLTQFHFGNSELLIMSENTDSKDVYVFQQEQHNH